MLGRRSPLAFALALGWGVVALLPARAASACCEPERIVDHDWKCLAPGEVGCTVQVPVVDQIGGVYTTWNSNDGSLVVLASQDDGMSFLSTPIVGSTARAAALAGLAASDSGDVIVAWTDFDDHSLKVAVSHDQGQTFTRPIPIDSDPFLRLSTVTAQATGAGFLLTWQRGAILNTPPQTLWSSVSLDAGRTWSAPLQIDDPGPGMQGPASVLAVGLDVVAAWLSPDPAIVTVDQSHDGGRTWSFDLFLSRAIGGRAPILSTTGTGSFQVMSWQDGVAGAIQMSSSIDSGRSWSPIEIVAPNTVIATSMGMPDGRVAVAWSIESVSNPGYWDTWMKVSTDRGLPGTFAPEWLLLGGIQRTDDVRLVHGPDGQPWLLQGDYRDLTNCAATTPCESVYLSPPCKASSFDLQPVFQVDIDAAPYFTHSEDGRMVVSPSGRLQIFWLDYGDGGSASLRHAAFHPRPLAPLDFELPGLLRVTKSPALAHLDWTDSRSEATHYDVLEGTIGSLFYSSAYDHAGNPCVVPRVGASTSVDEAMPTHDTYWLIAPTACGGSGPAGYDSFARRTPNAGGVNPECAAP